MNAFDRHGILWTVDSRIAALLPQAAQDFMLHFPGSWIELIQAYRSPVEQAAVSNAGHSPFDGQTTFSKHQIFPAQAVDWGVYDPAVSGRWVSDGRDYRYSWVGAWFEQKDLTWGGRWRHPDFDHAEIPGSNPTLAQVEAGAEAYRAALAARGTAA